MKRLTAALIGMTLLVAACGGSSSSTTSTATTPATTPAPMENGETLTVATSALGDHLVDGAGRTLYLFKPDAQGESTCYDQCEANWPPFTGTVTAGSGVDAGLIGSTTRNDGSSQVTYNGWPLYLFANDAAPGDTNGQGINDVWYVVAANGDAIE